MENRIQSVPDVPDIVAFTELISCHFITLAVIIALRYYMSCDPEFPGQGNRTDLPA